MFFITETDVIYASFANKLHGMNATNPYNACNANEISCLSTTQCISQDKWCDNAVDCLDSSDETACSCRSRLDQDKICDGYLGNIQHINRLIVSTKKQIISNFLNS